MNMNYGICNESAGANACELVANPIESLSDMMQSTRMIADDVLRTARRINEHLFGIGVPCNEKEAEPKCLRDDLEKTRRDIKAALDELYQLCGLLGI